MTETKKQLPHWVKRGILGAVIVPVAYIGLAVLQSLVPYGGLLYKAIHGMVWGMAAPVIVPIEKMGIHGCEMMGYIVPMFFLVALYLAAIGFGVGTLIAWWVKNKRGPHNIEGARTSPS